MYQEKKGIFESWKSAKIDKARQEIELLKLEIEKAKLRKELDKITAERIEDYS